MKTIKMYYFWALAIALVALVSSCQKDDIEDEMLRGGSRKVYVDSDSGVEQIQITSNSTWNARLSKESESWMTLNEPYSGGGDGVIEVAYKANNYFHRRGAIYVSSGLNQVVDTVYVMQYGRDPMIEFVDTQFDLSSVSFTATSQINTNIPTSYVGDMTLNVDYDGADKEWISDVKISPDLEKLSVSVSDNTNFEARRAKITLSFVDEWEQSYDSSIDVIQGIPGGTPQTQVVSFEQIRELITEESGEIVIDQDLAIAGHIISDCESANVAGAPMPAAKTKPDQSINYKTAYLQNDNATYGVALVTTDKEQNNLKRYDKLTLWCKGLTLTKSSNPTRYTISGVDQQHFVTKTDGVAEDIPVKRRYIAELTDNDLYTFVTLKRCQMATRRGRFAPIHTNYFRDFHCYYPSVVMDKYGDMLYLMTNYGTSWQYEDMPDGDGLISGVIVNEPYTHFVKGGDIGKYQIRNITREEIDLEASVDDGFSAIAVEWAPSGSSDPRAYGYPQYPHPANAEGKAHCVAATTGSGLSFMSTYAWLAVGNSYIKADGEAQNSTAWGHSLLWNTTTDSGNSVIFEFSTSNITSDVCHFAFTSRYYSGQGALRYWVAEYSLNGDDWTEIEEFTVNDQGNWSAMQLEQLTGDKNYCMKVPSEILGHDVAWIRLRPISKQTGTATTYDTGTIAANGQMSSSYVVSYAALRYNR